MRPRTARNLKLRNLFQITNWNKNIINEFVEDLYKEREFCRSWHIDKETLRQKIDSFPKDQLSYQTLCKIIYLSYPSPFDKQQTLIIGDKKPLYSIFIPDIIEVFPDAKFIHIIRDYRDNIVSNRKVFSRKNVALLAYAWKHFNMKIEKEKEKRRNAFYTIKYEDLATFPEKFAIEICNFLEIKFYPQMLDFHKKVKERYNQYKVKEIKDLHPNMMNPVNTSQIAKWKKELSYSEVEVAEFIAGDYAKRYGYDPTVNNRKFRNPISSLAGLIRYKMDNLVIKTYYKLPFFVRSIIRNFSDKFYVWFGYTNYYNRLDFMLKSKK